MLRALALCILTSRTAEETVRAAKSILFRLCRWFSLHVWSTWTNWPAFQLFPLLDSQEAWFSPWCFYLLTQTSRFDTFPLLGFYLCARVQCVLKRLIKRFVSRCSKRAGTKICNVFSYVPSSRSSFFFFVWKGHVHWLYNFPLELCQKRSTSDVSDVHLFPGPKCVICSAVPVSVANAPSFCYFFCKLGGCLTVVSKTNCSIRVCGSCRTLR